MSKYKVCIYAICKNEEKFVERWFNSMKEANEIFVLDTGSTDNTVEMLKEKGVHVKTKIIKPWRFDIARNEAMNMIPDDYDICISTDLDEVFNPGWRCELEKVWKKDTNRLRFTYNWSLDEKNNPIVSFYYEKAHSRKNYKWINPVHEVLKYNCKNEKFESTEKIVLNHYPDNKKSRSSYLPLLELSVKEDPYNDRNMHYLGREYMYYERWNECIDTLIKHLKLPKSTWKDERCASMRFIARSYQRLDRYDEAIMWLLKAIEEAPYLRDPYVELALLYYNLEDWIKVEFYCNEALKILIHQKTYINEIFSWNETIYDLLSISCYYNKKYDQSLYFVNQALNVNKDNKRILNNKEIILKRMKAN